MSIAVAILIGMGAALVLGAVLSWLLGFLERLYRLRASAGYRAAVMMQKPERRDDPLGLERYPWTAIRLGAVIVLALVALALRPPLVVLAPIGYLLPELFLRRYFENRARTRLRLEVRDLLSELRLLLAVGTSLGPALEVASRAGTGPLRQALAQEVGGDVYGRLPEQMLSAVATRLQSPDLRSCLARLESARQGTESYREALAEAVNEISESIGEEAEVAVEGAPTRIILPMLVCLMLPILVLGLYPPLAAMVAAISGIPLGG
jgi:tight adherence protein C